MLRTLPFLLPCSAYAGSARNADLFGSWTPLVLVAIVVLVFVAISNQKH